MSTDFLGERGEALEIAFFHNQDVQLLKQMGDLKATASQKATLATISGLQDDALLDHLVSLSIEAHTLAALTLIPLVEMAWADGRIEDREKRTVLDDAVEHGIARGSECWTMLSTWFEEKPPPALFEAWKEYIKAISATLENDERAKLRDEILSRAHAVAKAAGGVFGGFGPTVSPGEKYLLNELAEAFDIN